MKADTVSSVISPIQFLDQEQVHHLPVPLARLSTCGMIEIAVLKEVISTDPPLGRYQVIASQTLRGRGAVPALMLLKLLASQPHRFASKDWLSTQMHEEMERGALIRLDTMASQLRTLLSFGGLDHQETSAVRLLLVEYLRNGRGSGPGYRLASYPFLWLDSDALACNVEQAARMERFGQSQDAVAFWQRAYALASRGTFLPDDLYSGWAADKRAEIEGALRQSVHALARFYLAQQGEAGTEEAMRLLRSYWLSHKTDEDVLRPLMELLGKDERYQEAEAYYQQLCEALDATERGKQPDDRTRDIREFLHTRQIQRQRVEAPTTNMIKGAKTGETGQPSPQDSRTSSFSLTNGQNSAFSLLSQVMTPAIIEAMRDLGGQDMERSRRLLFQLFGTSVAALLGLSQDTESGMNILQRWDQQVLFEQQLAALWDVYHTGGTAQADYKLKILLTHSENSLRHSQAAELLCMSYQLQGSLYRDMMNYDDAHNLYQQAFEAAKELDDAELMSAALARRGVTLIQQNKATAAIAYLNEAHGLIRSHTLPCLTGYIFQALSEAYAIAQQEHESKRHIDAAQQVLSDRGKVPERSHCQANTTSVTAQMGVNAVHLHHYATAITLIEQGMENYNPTFVRGRARLKAQQAEAYYGLGDIRACCQSATEAWILARAASSNKTFARLRNLQRDLILSPQKKAPEVVDLNWVMTSL